VSENVTLKRVFIEKNRWLVQIMNRQVVWSISETGRVNVIGKEHSEKHVTIVIIMLIACEMSETSGDFERAGLLDLNSMCEPHATKKVYTMYSRC